MNTSTIRRDAEAALDSLSELVANLTLVDSRDGLTVLERITEAMHGHPRSGRLDAQRGGSVNETVEMPYATGDPERPLVQVPTSVPRPRNDPTGEAAIRPDPAKADLNRIERSIGVIAREANRAADVLAHYQLRDANAIEQQEDQSEDGCQSCARIPGPGHVGRPKSQQHPFWNRAERSVELGDGSKVDLCGWCRKRVMESEGELPTRVELEHYRDTGKRMKRAS